MVFTFFILTTLISYGFSIFRVCVPYSQFHRNGQTCYCDGNGRWTEAECRPIERHEQCRPGEVILNRCSRCICGDNAQLLCTNIPCKESSITRKPIIHLPSFEATGPWCIPFISYYVNCTFCTCPASGITAEADCVADNYCRSEESTPNFATSSQNNICIPKVMYLFSCLHCLCPDNGYFTANQCVDKCQIQQKYKNRSCLPGTFYKNECNICWCPLNGIQINTFCSKNLCWSDIKFQSLGSLENRISKCQLHTFTSPICFYCNCDVNGNINSNSCHEMACLNIDDFKYDYTKLTCSPGELLPICMECFCLQNGFTNKTYCTKTCSIESKMSIVEKILLDSRSSNDLINLYAIERNTLNNRCTPSALYIDQGRYCLCPDSGYTNSDMCTSLKGVVELDENHRYYQKTIINFNSSCEAGTFVNFDCNTCYCMKNGKFDPKWCTNDDCRAKKNVEDNYKTNYASITVEQSVLNCVPGTMSKEDCNFCICPDSGILKDRACTKNDCDEFRGPIRNDKLLCEPLTYYTIDCNICFCPRDGLKNIVKCTKEHCEINFLRSSSCRPGDLFSENCNVCVCPPNGDKQDRACTNHTCSDVDTPWQNILKISQNFIENRDVDDTVRNLDLCFPGEEFTVGCQVCVCPELGLKEYASCTTLLCTDVDTIEKTDDKYVSKDANKAIGNGSLQISRRDRRSCMSYNLTDSSERKECTPGSMYIIRCRQCICPYMGNINYFCRPLPKGFYCEQAYPNYNYLPMGRRDTNGLQTVNKTSASFFNATQRKPIEITVKHNHTRYKCQKPGRIEDDCHICDCEHGVIIQEHCYQSDNMRCTDTVPSFLKTENKIIS